MDNRIHLIYKEILAQKQRCMEFQLMHKNKILKEVHYQVYNFELSVSNHSMYEPIQSNWESNNESLTRNNASTASSSEASHCTNGSRTALSTMWVLKTVVKHAMILSYRMHSTHRQIKLNLSGTTVVINRRIPDMKLNLKIDKDKDLREKFRFFFAK